MNDALLNLQHLPRPLDWRALFGDDRPVELEIGIGKGRSLLADAAARPERGYVGLELVRAYLKLVDRRARRRGLTNVRLVHEDAGLFLTSFVAPGSLAAVRAYCPDPWPKKRHQRRRLFTYGYIETIAQALRPGGHFLLASDHGEYFGEIEAFVDLCPAFGPAEITMKRPGDGLERAVTNYERKWLSLGLPVYTLIARRRPLPGEAGKA